MHNRPIIAIVAGHSGGHIIPGLTYAKQLRAQSPHPQIALFSTQIALDKKIAAADASADHHIALALTSAPQGNFFKLARCAWQTAITFGQSIWHLSRLKPQKVIAMGGYVSVPVCLAAWLLRIPIELFELNVIPGKAILFLARFATVIHLCFEKTERYFPHALCKFTDYPVRFSENERMVTPRNARLALALDPDKKTIFIQGGSQGSLFINNAIKQFVERNHGLHASLQIIHQTGSINSLDWQHFYQQYNIPAIVFAYNHDVALYYCAADLIICRSGAGTLFEVGFFNKQCITIPLETPATDHQWYNGTTLAKLWPDLVSVIKQTTIEQQPEQFFTEIRAQLAVAPNITHHSPLRDTAVMRMIGD